MAKLSKLEVQVSLGFSVFPQRTIRMYMKECLTVTEETKVSQAAEYDDSLEVEAHNLRKDANLAECK